jgi:glutathione S-transferase
MSAVRIVGTPVSPFVRKVLVFLRLKNVPFEIDPLIPFFANERYAALNPLGRIPLLMDDEVTLADSSVICQYLEDRYPQPALYPAAIAARARARWLEEYSDTHMREVILLDLFFEIATKPFIWGVEPDPGVVARARDERLPKILDYLEAQIPEDGFLCGDFSIADIAIAAPFRNLRWSRIQVDSERRPRTAGFVERAFAHPGFADLHPIEKAVARAPVAQQRAVLEQMGWKVMAESFSAAKPRRLPAQATPAS